MTYPLVTINGSFTVGTDPYTIDAEGIDGLGVPPLRTNDVIRGHQDGSVGANDYLDVRVLTIPVTVSGDDPDDCLANVDALTSAWSPSDTDITLQIQLTESYILTYTGRPGAAGQSPVDVDYRHLYKGSTVYATLLFRVLDSGGLDT